jgi:hypothetical protein
MFFDAPVLFYLNFRIYLSLYILSCKYHPIEQLKDTK